MEKKAILLVRVSSHEQDYKAQIYDLKEYGASLGYTDFHVVQTKETAFADLTHKVGTNDMFKYIEDNPQFNTVLTTEISRLARRQSILHQIKEHCVNRNIQIIIKDMDFKLFDNDGKVNQQSEMIFALFGMFAESEVKQKLERFTRKRKELMQLGISISGKLLFGYDRFKLENDKNTLIVNEEQATIVRTIFNWYLNGLNNIKNPSIKAISIECIKRGYHPYTHSKRNVNKLLKEEAYTGDKTTNNKRKNPKFGLVLNETEYLVSSTKIKYPVIIERMIFDKVQIKLKSNITQGDKETKHITILSKLLSCPSCGRKMQGNYRKSTTGNKNSYRCTSRADSVSCASVGKSLSMNLIDSAVWSLIKTDLSALSAKINEINPDEYLVEIENQLSNLNQREKQIQNEIDENLAILSSVGRLKSIGVLQLIEDTSKKIEKLESDLNKIQQEKSKLESNKLMIFDKQSDIESVIKDNIEMIEGSKELLKKYINTFVSWITILEHNVKYTILDVNIRDYTYLNHPELAKHVPDNFPVSKGSSYIFLDKTVTRQIKGVYYEETYNWDDKYPIPELSIDDAVPMIKNELKSGKYKIGKGLHFKKLSV
ncbi:recombinase family protein [Flavobacterium pectinovorum]|uniref:recombinase family protein n=1 Tax=Flavobacterium pectinovorum TaxID=29533 RepID=UPI00265F4510|nr:recombinase family protein [Flavobacterium pectinovorum]WKL47930.1 recombinase family protein [Flavobacterium pectinovorum]